MKVRAKFHVGHIDGQNIHMSPVYSGSPENEAFFKATPGGQISLFCLNPEALAQFKVGEEFYVDFIPAKQESAS